MAKIIDLDDARGENEMDDGIDIPVPSRELQDSASSALSEILGMFWSVGYVTGYNDGLEDNAT